MAFAFAVLAHDGVFSGYEVPVAVLYVLLQLIWSWFFTFRTKR